MQRSSQHPMYFLDFHCCLYSPINSGRYGRDLVALRALRYGKLYRPFCFSVTLAFLGLDAVGYHYLLVPVILSLNDQYLSHVYKECWLKLLLCTDLCPASSAVSAIHLALAKPGGHFQIHVCRRDAWTSTLQKRDAFPYCHESQSMYAYNMKQCE